ncbi:MAG: preprotein translocase subunit SecA [Deltaproteobacteria bacterium]|nr:preprotein translocase subunit SecA [Deltaproteobacteria bacterium]
MISFLVKKIFGTKNARELKRLAPIVGHVGELERAMQAKSDDDLRAMTPEFRRRLGSGESLDAILPEAFAVVREAGRRVLGMRHFDVQLIGGMMLHNGSIAEMRTGEGKTLVATLPAYLNALTGKGVHVVTVNDYLARRDAEWMGRLHHFLGLSVGVVVHGLTDEERQAAYRSDITYGQNNEFGFDYLRDNMKLSPDRMVQRQLNFAIVDEVDSILVDEARTPLIISGPAEQSADLYYKVNQVIPRLTRDVDYTVDEKHHSAMLTDQGVERVEKLLGVPNLYDPKYLEYNHHVTQALRAHTLYKRDVNYLVEEGKVVIVDEFTGRKMPGRRWSDGLHQAIEAKENVNIEEENQTLATITFQNYFRMYNKLCGMTGTADTEAEEFHKIYKLNVAVIPTNRPMIREDRSDLVYKNEKGKFRAAIAEIEEAHKLGRPVLVGTVSVEKSEVVSQLLKKKGLPHHVLNAKFHEMEAAIVAQAGRKGAITISTNMAGRGTDIILGGNPEFMAKAEVDPTLEPEKYAESLAKFKAQCAAEREEVVTAGGLHIVGTERHESRRIDNQLRGRAARQGDPGSSRFYMSLEDDLLRIFGGDRLTTWMERLGMEEDVPIEHPWVNRAIENAQRRVEGHNFDIRKHLLEYDDVMNQQRKAIYALRRQVLDGRYAPEVSEEEKKAGKTAEAPTQSGDWTMETLSPKVRPQVEKIVERFLAPPAEVPKDDTAKAPDGEKAVENEMPPPASALPPKRSWRILRAEIWRQYGALCELEKLVEEVHAGADHGALMDSITTSVASSLIQQRERVYDLCDRLISDAVEAACPPNTHVDDWNFEQLEGALSELFNVKIDVDRASQDVGEIAGSIWNQVEEVLKKREEELSFQVFLYFARHFWLEEVDSQWIDHLKAMDHLREGIGLRGYGQKDPKQEYKKEGFALFAAMTEAIARNVSLKLFRVQIVRQEEELPEFRHKQRKMVAVHPGNSQGGSTQAQADSQGSAGGAPEKPQTVRRTEPKVGRNDPCPCGSGKKYKKCHGASVAAADS